MKQPRNGGSLPLLDPKRVVSINALRPHHISQVSSIRRVVHHSKERDAIPIQKPKHLQNYNMDQFDDSLLQLIQNKTSAHQNQKDLRDIRKARTRTEPNKQGELKISRDVQECELSEAQLYYLNRIKGQTENPHKTTQFTNILRRQNPLFLKVNPVVGEAMLKLGKITSYQSGDTVFREGVPIRNIGILLWGQVLFKKRKSKFRFSGYPGSGMGEQLIFEGMDFGKRGGEVNKGEFLTFEGCKAIRSSGILFVGWREYSWMRQELLLRGLKDGLQCLENLLQRIYLRKREQRQLYG